jgi:hypothetical protein
MLSALSSPPLERKTLGQDRVALRLRGSAPLFVLPPDWKQSSPAPGLHKQRPLPLERALPLEVWGRELARWKN